MVSCNSNKKLNAISDKAYQKEVNYIPYYLKVYEAKELYDSKEYEKNYNLLDSLFRYYQPIETPTIYEMDIYCELSKKLKKYNNEILKSILKTETLKYCRKPYADIEPGSLNRISFYILDWIKEILRIFIMSIYQKSIMY